jgi:hypothetical protein
MISSCCSFVKVAGAGTDMEYRAIIAKQRAQHAQVYRVKRDLGTFKDLHRHERCSIWGIYSM